MQAMLRMAFRLGANLETAFKEVNNQLADTLASDRFITAFVGMLAGKVLIWTTRAISSSWRIFSPSITASVIRTRCSATAHCAASAVASASS